MASATPAAIPVIDISPLLQHTASPDSISDVDNRLGQACTDVGFLYIVGHGIPDGLQADLHRASAKFFALDVERKRKVAMALGGKAWRGWFPVGDELTSGRPDQKEGFYLGSEDGDSPLPLHGRNLWPDEVPELRVAVDKYMSHCCNLGQVLMQSLVRYLRVDASVFMGQFDNPTTLFRIFNYPPHADVDGDGLPLFGVGEHTDYGYLTLLLQDNSGGLQEKLADGSWIDAPPIPGSLVVNLGDALEHNTGCLIKATPHRVRHTSKSNRMSFPFFFDPSFPRRMESIVSQLPEELQRRAQRNRTGRRDRWDGSQPELFEGQYGVYLMKKVSKVFPELAADYIRDQHKL